MDNITFEIGFILFLLVANGAFSMSEMAIVSARKARLQQRANDGDKGALAALRLANNPGSFLSTVQIGITLVGILAGAFGGATLAEKIAPLISGIPRLEPYAKTVSFVLVVIVITYLSLVIGELIPKRLALHSPDRVASLVAGPMRRLSTICAPIVRLLEGSTNGLLRLIGLHDSKDTPVTEDEIKVLIEQGIEAGVFEEAERDLIERTFHLGDRLISELMVPRTEVVWLDINDPPELSKQRIRQYQRSRFPVVQGTPDNVLGIVRTKDLLARALDGQPFDLNASLRPALYLPDAMPAFRAIEAFKAAHRHMALVIDEFGGVEGLVTVTDILEALVGDIPSIDRRIEQPVVEREDGTLLVDGTLQLSELKKMLKVKKLPGEESNGFQTLGGFVMARLGRVPAVADYFEWNGCRFEVMDMDRNRVDKVLISRPNHSTRFRGVKER
ncbi:MAG: HlyC/CorC family transporter [Acidobacteria bacterium]|nr:HlyC/CorC family transporter [Acidobacteriota bacterium]